jgi:hypothetical protein
VTAFRRRQNLLIGLLLALVVALVIVAIVGLGAPATQVPNGAIGVPQPVPFAEPTPTPTPPPVVSVPEKGPVALESPSTFEIDPGVRADCGRIDRAACEQAITLAKIGNEGDIVGTTLIVVDDTCPPATECDPPLPFDALVTFVTAGGDTTGWYVYHVVATDPTVPPKADRWEDEIPQHIVDRIRAALATP